MERQSDFCKVTQLIDARSAGLRNPCAFHDVYAWKPVRVPKVKQCSFFVKACQYGALRCLFTWATGE